MTEVLLRTEAITKEFSSVRVLDGISIEVRKGEIPGIIGENGAGKSTFIKILSGIYTPTRGRVFLDGKEVALRRHADAKRAGISLIPQEFNFPKAEDGVSGVRFVGKCVESSSKGAVWARF